MEKIKDRWVIKTGSSLVAGSSKGINQAFIQNLVAQVNNLLKKNIQVIIVSSGAVAKGIYELQLNERPASLHLLQATAAVGQVGLINSFQSEFSKFEIKTAQVLISHNDIANRERYLNARRSLTTLLEMGVVPIVNENDSVAIEEISFGDNDTLAGAIVGLIDADKFIMLTDQKGIYSQDPKHEKSALLLRTINLDNGSVDIKKITDGSSNLLGRGGMKTKIKAAKLSLEFGAKTWVADGNDPYVLESIFEGQNVGTLFKGERDKLQSRKKWIASLGVPSGKLIIDEGAVKAIGRDGRSLLPVGVVKIVGEFEKGSLVTCLDINNEEVARGFSNFNSSEMKLILRLKSEKVSSALGYASEEEVIHRNNLVLS